MASISTLPREILLYIFQLYLESRNQKLLIVNLSKVCRDWKCLCKDSSLWKKYDGTLDFKQMMAFKKNGYLKKTKEFILSATETLTNEQASELFSGLINLNIVNFYKVVRFEKDVLSIVANNCPNLCEIHFSSYGDRKTQTNVKQVNYDKLGHFLSVRGFRLITVNLSHCDITNLALIIRCIADCCPNLEQLHLIHMYTSRAAFPTKYVQERCPKLKVLHLDQNVSIGRNRHVLGFENLQVFTFHDSSGYHLTDKEFESVAFNSVHLKFLNLTNCNISTESACSIPACSVEYLYIAKSKMCNSNNLSSVLQKWSHSLKEVDVSNSSDRCINEAIISLISTPVKSPLVYLNLNSTKVTADVIEKVLDKCEQLEELHLESCRYLGRGMKQVYHGKSELKALLNKIKLFDKMVASED